jgi:asparagine synthase (glutamine-hydrolysing)
MVVSGIAGMMTCNGDAAPGRLLRAMAAAMARRGPEGEGHYRSADCGMVETRLASGEAADEIRPVYDSGGAALIADGAIYNTAELTRALADAGAPIESAWDLPLRLYRRSGIQFARDLRGMHALALHDPATGRLLLARDPFGIKPLYYAATPQGLAFASEPQALVAADLVSPALAPAGRNELLQMQFTTGRETIFSGIERVLPGETVVVRRGRIVERCRHEALPAAGPLELDEDEALARLDMVLADSVAAHLRGTGRFGLFLSGGIDSSALLAAAAQLGNPPCTLLTLDIGGVENPDERLLARAAARSIGVEPVEIGFDEADFWHLLPQVAAAADDPAADYALLPAWKLAAAARESGVSVVLSGEGGDELFGGYGRYRSVMRPWWAGGRMPRARGILDDLDLVHTEIAGWRDGIAAAEARSSMDGRTRLQVAQAVDCADWLPNDLLLKLDRCATAHGIEARTPFLDPQIAAFAFRLPDELKIRRGLGKWLLRRWLAGRLPQIEPLVRRRGAALPIARWIAGKAAEIGPLVARSAGVQALCDPAGVERVFAAAAQKRAGRAASCLLFYALWYRRHIEGLELPPDTMAALAA